LGLGFLAGLFLSVPMTGAAVGATLGAVGATAAKHLEISDDFIRDVKALMKPGTSGLFVLDDANDKPAILRRIQGLGGTVLKANVDLERARLIQSALLAARTGA